MYINKIFGIIFAIFLINFNISISKDIFFDIGGVLLETSQAKAISKLGYKCFFYPNLQQEFFNFMCYIDPKHDEDQDNEATYKGSKLPPLLCKWQKGQLKCYEVSELICKEAESHPEFFKNKFGGSGKIKKDLIKKSASLFLPENAVDITKPKKDMIKLVKELKNQKNKNGKPMHRLGVISNHDWETVQMLKKAYPEVFENFNEDMIIISSKVKMIKPNKNIFEYVKKRFKLSANPKDNIFVDDQNENIVAAQKYGFTGILHTSANKTKREFKKLGIFQKK